MPGSYGYIGLYRDALMDLDYCGAHYFDPLASQCIGPETVRPGDSYAPQDLSRHACVEGNPFIHTDPTGP